MHDALMMAMLTCLLILCWPWPKEGDKRRLRRIEEKMNAILKHLNIDYPSVNPQIVELARAGKKIEAIKLYREETRVSLKDAKYFVESL